MNILVCNDDGYDALGLKVLTEYLSQDKENVIYVLAPDSNRSAVSNHATMFSTLEIKKIDAKKHFGSDIGDNVVCYTCSGYPADCAGIGINSNLFDAKIDVVVSGINMGGNLGTDIVYSGTCAASRQAIFNGIPAIAVSYEPIDWNLVKPSEFKYAGLAKFVAKNLRVLASMCELGTNPEVKRTFVNINGGPFDTYKGIKYVDNLCKREYQKFIKIEKKADCPDADVLIANMSPESIDDSCDKSQKVVVKQKNDSDFVKDGYITITLLYAEPVCKKGSTDSIKGCVDLVL